MSTNIYGSEPLLLQPALVLSRQANFTMNTTEEQKLVLTQWQSKSHYIAKEPELFWFQKLSETSQSYSLNNL